MADQGQAAMTNELATSVAGETLPAPQQMALEMLVSGKSMAATARETGVGRTTLYRWMKEDPAFMAAYNRWHDEVQSSAKSRMLALMDKAADAVEKSLDAGDGKLGMRVLETMGVAKAYKVGATDEEEVLSQQKAEDERSFSFLLGMGKE